MGRLGMLIVVLAVVVAAAIVVQLRVVPTMPLSGMTEAPKRLSKADQKKLEAAQARFAEERDRFLQMRNAGAPEAELAAQNAKASEAAKAVVELGGTQALRSVGKSKYASQPSQGNGAKSQTNKAGQASKGGDPASSCSGEEGGSCSGEGGICSISPSDKAEGKEAGKTSSAKPVTKP